MSDEFGTHRDNAGEFNVRQSESLRAGGDHRHGAIAAVGDVGIPTIGGDRQSCRRFPNPDGVGDGVGGAQAGAVVLATIDHGYGVCKLVDDPDLATRAWGYRHPAVALI